MIITYANEMQEFQDIEVGEVFTAASMVCMKLAKNDLGVNACVF